MDYKELYQALEYAKPQKPEFCDSFQCYKDENYHEQFNGINLSRLFSLLIKETARLADYYQSDIFYDLEKLNNDLKGENSVLFDRDSYTYVIGIRDSGTDGADFMITREAGNADTFRYLYRVIYYIRITPDGKHLKKLECFKVDPDSLDYYFKRKTLGTF